MRVLIVTSLYQAGNGNWVADQVRSLRDAGVDAGVVFFDTKRSRWNYVLSIPRIARALRSEQYDVVHTHHTYTLLDVLVAKGLARSRVPVVLTTHEGEVLDRDARARTWHPTSRLRNSIALKRYAARRADFVIFVNRQLASRLAFDGHQEVIPCGVDLDKFRPLDRGECRRRLGVPKDAIVIFFPASPKRRLKHFRLAQDALAIVRREFPDALMLTGGGIPSDQMPYYYNASDVMVQTSFFEASPTVVKEALGCEVPVVSTDVGDTREVINGIPCCVVCTEDPAEVALQLLAARGGRAVGAREHLIAQELDLPQVARRIIRIYEQVVAG